MMGSSHPAFYYVRRCKRFQYFTDCGEFSLGANYADGIILAYISACH
jgi:hypothetical protein